MTYNYVILCHRRGPVFVHSFIWIVKVRRGGDEYGLSLSLSVGEADKTGVSDVSKGIAVFVHEAGTEPDFSSGTLVSVGTFTNIEITQTNYTSLK